MRAFLGALVLGAGASAVAVLLAVAEGEPGSQRDEALAAHEACDSADRSCGAATAALVGGAGRLASSDGQPKVPPSVVPVLKPDHPYPDHP